MINKEDTRISGDLTRHIFMLVFLGGLWLYPWVYKTAAALREATKRETGYYTSPTAQLLLFIFIPFYSIYWFYKTASTLKLYAYRYGNKSAVVGLCTFIAFLTNIIPATIIQMEIERLVEACKAGEPAPKANKVSSVKPTATATKSAVDTKATAPAPAKTAAPETVTVVPEKVTVVPEKETPPPAKTPATADDDDDYDYDEDYVRRIQPDGFDKGGFSAVEMDNAPWMPVTDHDEGICPVCGRQVTLQTSGNYTKCSGCHVVLKVVRGAIMLRDSDRKALEKRNKIAIQNLKRAKKTKQEVTIERRAKKAVVIHRNDEIKNEIERGDAIETPFNKYGESICPHCDTILFTTDITEYVRCPECHKLLKSVTD